MICSYDDIPQYTPLNVELELGRKFRPPMGIDHKPSSFLYIECTQFEFSYGLPKMTAQTFAYHHCHVYPHLQSENKIKKLLIVE